ncbi:monocarboxylate transporter 12-like isoform X2 [Mytilus galloprovincialis]|uniref:monocarboxylate transporter 12-like isoform X2 n=1 Tax=Mytilus galloprovincialis TaxID=29158 RepID=UPI003F7CA764
MTTEAEEFKELKTDTQELCYEFTENKVPDGGWGWVVLVCSFFVMFMIDGLFGSYGLLLPVLMENLHASPSLTSLAGSVIVGCLLFIGCGMGLMYLPAIVMVNQYFDKKRGIAQSIMSAGSGIGLMVISPVTEKLLDVYSWRGTLLILAGFFLQLCVACAMFRTYKVISPQNKNAKETKAMGEIFKEIEILVDQPNTGCVEHDTILSVKSLDNDNYNKRIESLQKTQLSEKCTKIQFEGKCCKKHAMQFAKTENFKHSTSSLPQNMFRTPYEKSSFLPFRSSHCISEPHQHSSSLFKNINKGILSQKDIFYCGSLTRLKHNTDTKSLIGSIVIRGDEYSYSKVSLDTSNPSDESDYHHKACNEGLCANKAFWFIAIAAVLSQMAQFIPNMFLGDYGKTIGLSSMQVSWIFSVFGVVNTLGRLLPGFIIDNTKLSSVCLCVIGMAGCTITCFMFPLCDQFASLMAFSSFFGFFIAFYCPLQPIMVLDSVGLDNLTNGLGVLTVLKAPAAVFGPPFAGVLYEWTKNYDIAILFAGCLCLLTIVVYLINPIYNYLKSLCNSNNDNSSKTLSSSDSTL